MGSGALQWWSVWTGLASVSDEPHRPQKINPEGFSKAHFGPTIYQPNATSAAEAHVRRILPIYSSGSASSPIPKQGLKASLSQVLVIGSSSAGGV
jgi:hypothetical protein